jgi:hypothetical protein
MHNIKKKRLGLGVVKRARPDLPHHFWRSVPKFKLDSFSWSAPLNSLKKPGEDGAGWLVSYIKI